MTEIGKEYLTNAQEEKTELIEMTVYSALNKRKVYLDRLSKLKSEAGQTFVGAAAASAPDINGISRESYINKCKSCYDKAVSIIRNFYVLNAAISQSNAMTTVVIAGKTYTVAEAIIRYDRINEEIEFLNSITKQLATAQSLISRMNTDKLSEKSISDHVTKMMETINISTNGETENTEDIINTLRETYIKRNTFELIDPYNHAENINDKIDALKAFLSEFNEAINICNMQTVISVNLISE